MYNNKAKKCEKLMAMWVIVTTIIVTIGWIEFCDAQLAWSPIQVDSESEFHAIFIGLIDKLYIFAYISLLYSIFTIFKLKCMQISAFKIFISSASIFY